MEKWGTNCAVLSCLPGLTYNKYFGSILASSTGTNPHLWCHSGTGMLQCSAWPGPTAWKDEWGGGSYVILTIALCPGVAVLWADRTRWACPLPAGLFFCQHTNIHKDMPREVVQSASLEIFKNCLVMVLGRQLSVALGFDQMTPPEVSSNLRYSVIPWFCEAQIYCHCRPAPQWILHFLVPVGGTGQAQEWWPGPATSLDHRAHHSGEEGARSR